MPFARLTDPETSHEAAESVRDVSETQQRILDLLTNKPQTDFQLVENYRRWNFGWFSESGIRSRRAELVSMGKVQDSGNREKLPSGRNAIVWERTNA
jgi:hypothetical protein